MQTPAGLSGSIPFADSATGILPNRWPQANQDNATEKQPGAASVWQQKQKVFLMTSTDRNLPALVVNFGDSSAELSQASAAAIERSAARTSSANKTRSSYAPTRLAARCRKTAPSTIIGSSVTNAAWRR